MAWGYLPSSAAPVEPNIKACWQICPTCGMLAVSGFTHTVLHYQINSILLLHSKLHHEHPLVLNYHLSESLLIQILQPKIAVIVQFVEAPLKCWGFILVPSVVNYYVHIMCVVSDSQSFKPGKQIYHFFFFISVIL